MKRLTSCANVIEAHTLKGLLERDGIEVFLKGEMLAGALGELPVDMAQVELYVSEEQWSRASSIIEQYTGSTIEEAEEWTCQSCHEDNGREFEYCWNCQAQPS
ncbi:DUF2007 domain-containing protein [Pleionea sp. CnH1-48]|uniref:putative signal transducing protein n=1 Tax=Pleionea sp. CnH1-48 TaxID=2954494 RepID=UPI00209735E8|nr:DUF2007 domain-containing protein [Pleionea sp. CnH1-48]MCO7224838.1 DUF2007 domain-containing protein [Pleionea sp. CnH1-48]